MVLADEPGYKPALQSPSPEFAFAFLLTAARTGFFDADAFEKLYGAAERHVTTETVLKPHPVETLALLSKLGIKERRLGRALCAAICRSLTQSRKIGTKAKGPLFIFCLKRQTRPPRRSIFVRVGSRL